MSGKEHSSSNRQTIEWIKDKGSSCLPYVVVVLTFGALLKLVNHVRPDKMGAYRRQYAEWRSRYDKIGESAEDKGLRDRVIASSARAYSAKAAWAALFAREGHEYADAEIRFRAIRPPIEARRFHALTLDRITSERDSCLNAAAACEDSNMAMYCRARAAVLNHASSQTPELDVLESKLSLGPSEHNENELR